MPRDILARPPITAEERIHYGSGSSQFFDVFGSRGTPANVVIIHGGFWRSEYDLTHASHLCAALAHTGLTVASLEYRRAGDTGGGWPATFDDVRAGCAAASKGASPVVMGHSAGGHLALRLASEKQSLRGVVALAPVACLLRAYEENLGSGAVAAFLGGKPDRLGAVYADADPVKHASSFRRVLIHGTNDDVVPITNSREFVEVRGKDPGAVRLVEVPGADHFDLIDPQSKAWPIVLANIKQLLA